MLNEELNSVLGSAVDFAKEQRHEYITTEHIFYALLSNEKVVKILQTCGGDIDTFIFNLKRHFESNFKPLPKESMHDPFETVALTRVIDKMIAHVKSAQKAQANVADMLVALYKEERSYSVYLLHAQGISELDVMQAVSAKEHTLPKKEIHVKVKTHESNKDNLENFTINLIEVAKEGKIDPLIGRDNELSRMMQVLCRRKKNNPLLVGEPGVGKTAIVEGLALAIADKKTPKVLANASLYALDIGSLLSGTKYRGDFEKRLKGIINALENIDDAIIFIDEIHTIVGAGSTSGSSIDLSNLLKPSLASGKLRCIGATTYGEFRNFFDKDKALARRFAKIDIDEPNIEDSYKIVLGLKEHYEKHHGVKYPQKVLKSSVTLAKKYLRDRFLPDSAIDLIDEVGASFRLMPRRRVQVGMSDLEHTLSKMANIPNIQVNGDDTNLLKDLSKKLKNKVFGQDRAIEALSSAIKRSRAGLRNLDSPIGAFLFAGPTGVGKTEVAKQLANVLGVHFERFDMSEYMEKHTVSRLIGAPPGYVGFEEGGQLTETIRKHPYTVLLLDEIEKAHPDLLNILLQVFDNATLTDNNGLKSDFRNVIIIMTSNLGTKDGVQVGFTKSTEFKADEAIKNFFAPEFRNRLDAVVHFSPLETSVMIYIVEKMLSELEEQLQEKKIKIIATKKAKEYLAKEGYSDTLGARVMSRVIQEEVKTKLTDEILFGTLKNGGKVKIDYKNNKLIFEFLSE